MLERLVRLIDPLGDPARARPQPAPGEGPTDPWTFPWDVRTLIAPLPGAEPVLVLVNVLLGRFGIAGFTEPGIPERGARLILVVQGRSVETRRLDFTPAEIAAEQGVLRLASGAARYSLEGGWPAYRATYDDGEVSLDLALSCRGPLHHWSDVPFYQHYSAFGTARGAVARRGGGRAEVSGGVSLEHGRGRNLGGRTAWPLVSARLFHYEVGRLPSGDQWALVRFRFAGGLEAVRRGVYQRSSGAVIALAQWSASVRESCEVPAARAGEPPIVVPRVWDVAARSAGGGFELRYRGETRHEPFRGIGRLTSAASRLSAEVREGPSVARAEGTGYLEVMAR